MKVVEYNYNQKVKQNGDSQQPLLSEIEAINKRLSKARELLLNDDIRVEDYQLMKKEIISLEDRLRNMGKKSALTKELLKKLSNSF